VVIFRGYRQYLGDSDELGYDFDSLLWLFRKEYHGYYPTGDVIESSHNYGVLSLAITSQSSSEYEGHVSKPLASPRPV
jgi:hypothetical protein